MPLNRGYTCSDFPFQKLQGKGNCINSNVVIEYKRVNNNSVYFLNQKAEKKPQEVIWPNCLLLRGPRLKAGGGGEGYRQEVGPAGMICFVPRSVGREKIL